MKHEIDLKGYKVRTDLLSEILDRELKDYKREIKYFDDIKVETIELDKESAEVINKKEGIYKTIYFEDVTDEDNYKKLDKVLTSELKEFFKIKKLDNLKDCLIIGLGNRISTPDAIGPLTLDDIKVTRHLFTLGLDVLEKYRSIATFTPGVMGTTGIETYDAIMGIIAKVKPDFIIVIDSLCASSIDRLNKTIQITDTGIHPGSGIGNNRKELSYETLNIPVIAIGVPTVLEASTIVSNSIEYLFNHISYELDNKDKKSLKFVPTLNRNYKNHKEDLSKEEKEKLLGIVGSLDSDSNKLTEEVTTTGEVGTEYTTIKKEFDDYTFIMVEGPTSGEYDFDTIYVTYYYDKNTGTGDIMPPQTGFEPSTINNNRVEVITLYKKED